MSTAHGWRLVRSKSPTEGGQSLEWYCRSCWAVRKKLGAAEIAHSSEAASGVIRTAPPIRFGGQSK
jgi:hypothetical protein